MSQQQEDGMPVHQSGGSGEAHTAGPWDTELAEVYAVRDSQGGRIAILTHLTGPHGCLGRRSGAEVAANCRLIAAAPDLLAEHQEWARMLGEAFTLALQEDYSKVDELARLMRLSFSSGEPRLHSAAIAKATGARS